MDWNMMPYVPGTYSAADAFPSTLAVSDPFYGGLTAYGGVNPGALQARVQQDLALQKQEMLKYSPILSVDIYEKDAGHYEIHADLPGVDGKDLDITVDTNQIEIKAVRRHIHDVDTDTVHVQERTFGEVKRSLRLPTDCDAEKASVEFKNSVLTVTFPKKETGKRKLTITSA